MLLSHGSSSHPQIGSNGAACNQWTSSAIPSQQLTIQTPRNLSLKLLLLKLLRLRQCLFVCGPMTTFPTIIASCSIITILHSLVLDVLLYERETCGQHMDINNVALIFAPKLCHGEHPLCLQGWLSTNSPQLVIASEKYWQMRQEIKWTQFFPHVFSPRIDFLANVCVRNQLSAPLKMVHKMRNS